MSRQEATATRGEDVIVTLSLTAVALVMFASAYMFLMPSDTPDFAAHIYWYLGRSAGLVAYWLLFGSVALGIAVSSRVFDGVLGRPWVFEVHKFLSIFVLLAMLFHVLILLPDPWAKFTVKEMFVPMESHYRPTPVALGIVTLYGSLVVTASFYLKRFIGGQKGWRWLHYATFGLFIMALLHGLFSGTDSERPAVQYSYLASGVAVLFLVFFRILATRAYGGKPRSERPAVPRPAAAAAKAAAPTPAAAGSAAAADPSAATAISPAASGAGPTVPAPENPAQPATAVPPAPDTQPATAAPPVPDAGAPTLPASPAEPTAPPPEPGRWQPSLGETREPSSVESRETAGINLN